MFTGIVEHLGEVSAVDDRNGMRRIVFDVGPLGEVDIGASLSINGTCLTVVATDHSSVSVDVVAETLSRTTLGRLVPGARVNVERPMAADGRFDGHMVQGHVDGVGKVSAFVKSDGGALLTVDTPEDLLSYVVEKGSVAVEGVSLTVTGVTDTGFSVALIPHTLGVTTLGGLQPGDELNLEVDVVAKYVERLLKVSR